MNFRKVNLDKYTEDNIMPVIGRYYICRVRDNLLDFDRTEDPWIVEAMYKFTGCKFVAWCRDGYGNGYLSGYYAWLPKWVKIIKETTAEEHRKYMERKEDKP